MCFLNCQGCKRHDQESYNFWTAFPIWTFTCKCYQWCVPTNKAYNKMAHQRQRKTQHLPKRRGFGKTKTRISGSEIKCAAKGNCYDLVLLPKGPLEIATQLRWKVAKQKLPPWMKNPKCSMGWEYLPSHFHVFIFSHLNSPIMYRFKITSDSIPWNIRVFWISNGYISIQKLIMVPLIGGR